MTATLAAAAEQIAKHTPGPWRVVGPSHETCKPYMGCWTVEGETNVANMCTLADAHLIAAAPDLLAALKDMHDSACTNHTSTPSKAAFLKARFVIAKAEGRS